MKKQPLIQRAKNDAVYHLARLAVGMGRSLPRKTGLRLFGALGEALFALPTPDRQRTIRHLGMVFGNQWDERRILSTARSVYRNLGKNLFDAIHVATLDDAAFDAIVRSGPLDGLKAAHDRGKGFMCVTGHIGCFEMLLPFFDRRDIRGFAIGRALYDPRIDTMVANARRSGNMKYLHRTENPRTIIRLLSEGTGMGVLIDQDTRTDGVFAHFLGKLAFTPSAPIKLAMRMKLPVFVASTARLADDTHMVTVTPQVEMLDTGNTERDLVLNVEKVNALLSEAILRHPEQWVWMHRRWKRTPLWPGMEGVANVETIEK